MMFELPADASGLRLARIDRKGDLILCESVIFEGGRSVVDMILRRALLSGHVKISKGNDLLSDHFADVMNYGDNTIVACVELDRHSYSSLKNHWMRCKVQAPLRERAKALHLTPSRQQER